MALCCLWKKQDGTQSQRRSLSWDSKSLDRSKITGWRFWRRKMLGMRPCLPLRVLRLKNVEGSGSHISLASLPFVGGEQAQLFLFSDKESAAQNWSVLHKGKHKMQISRTPCVEAVSGGGSKMSREENKDVSPGLDTAGNHIDSCICPRVDFIFICLLQFPFIQYLSKSVLLTAAFLGWGLRNWIRNVTSSVISTTDLNRGSNKDREWLSWVSIVRSS